MSSDPYQRYAASLHWLAEQWPARPGLAEIAAHSGQSPAYFQRGFKRWVGLSPKQFLQHLSAERARERLAAGATVLEAGLEAGLSGPGRLHDLLIRHDALTPGEWRRRGAGLVLHYGFHHGPLGQLLLAVGERGLSTVLFVDDARAAEARMRARLPRADHRHDPARTAPLVERLFGAPARGGGELSLLLAGSPFQLQVWRALIQLPADSACSYGALARAIGRPGAQRAVGAAVGANMLAVLVPCHRVIRADLGLGGYRWGAARKLALQAMESARRG